jgi:predicted transcriptional regulator
LGWIKERYDGREDWQYGENFTVKISSSGSEPRETRVMTSHVPVELAAQVDKYAVQMERSRSWIVKQALGDWVAWEQEKERRTLDGLADVDADRVVDHEDVVAWIESLSTDSPLPRPEPKAR